MTIENSQSADKTTDVKIVGIDVPFWHLVSLITGLFWASVIAFFVTALPLSVLFLALGWRPFGF